MSSRLIVSIENVLMMVFKGQCSLFCPMIKLSTSFVIEFSDRLPKTDEEDGNLGHPLRILSASQAEGSK